VRRDTTTVKPSRPRGRPREFVTADIRMKIRTCFSRQGYSGTTLADIVDATGLSQPSIYNAFGDKRTIFLQALDDEFEELSMRLHRLSEDSSLAERLTKFLQAVTADYRSSLPGQAPGVALGAALAEASADAEVRTRLQRFDDAFRIAAERTLDRTGGEAAASMLSALAVGLCVRSKCGSPLLNDIDCVGLALAFAQQFLPSKC
jgi:AcrR family transcriptional regulator